MDFIYYNAINNDLSNYLISLIMPYLFKSLLEVYNHSLKMFNSIQSKIISGIMNEKIIKTFSLENVNYLKLDDKEKEVLLFKIKLDIFKIYSDQIYRWNDEQIKDEYSRLKNVTKSNDFMDNLIKANLKSHLFFITYNPSNEEILMDDKFMDNSFFLNFKVYYFVYMSLIEMLNYCENNFEIFVKKIKKNELDEIIKNCILNSIKKSIPDYNEILKKYCDKRGIKMYRFLENLIIDKCKEKIVVYGE